MSVSCASIACLCYGDHEVRFSLAVSCETRTHKLTGSPFHDASFIAWIIVATISASYACSWVRRPLSLLDEFDPNPGFDH